jgi:hypothetical protein
MQTEKVDLENTVVDESQRQLNDQRTSSSTLPQDKFSGKFCNKIFLTSRADFVRHCDLYTNMPILDWCLGPVIVQYILLLVNELSISGLPERCI